MTILDFDALERNVRFFRNRISEDVRLCAVIKNNAYGHGAIHVATRLKPIVDMFAVGSAEEAEQISFLGKKTLVLLPQTLNNTARVAEAGASLTVDSFETLKKVIFVAQKMHKNVNVHIKIDSGMSRLGFTEEQIPSLIEQLKNSPLLVEGIFSHFWGETEEACDEQLQYFEKCVEMLKSHFPNTICHIANTKATLISSKYHLDMVRVGLGLYGYGDEELQPVKTVCADVISVKNVKANCSVGYGAIYRPKRSTRIAVLNTGYALGLPRVLIGAKVRIGENIFPIVAICMAMTMLDIGDADIHVGDRAILLGRDVDISSRDVIVYELLCNLK